MTTYTYQGDGMTDAETTQEWARYEDKNAKANQRYEFNRDTIDARYDPLGGGRRWAKRGPYTRRWKA